MRVRRVAMCGLVAWPSFLPSLLPPPHLLLLPLPPPRSLRISAFSIENMPSHNHRNHTPTTHRNTHEPPLILSLSLPLPPALLRMCSQGDIQSHIKIFSVLLHMATLGKERAFGGRSPPGRRWVGRWDGRDTKNSSQPHNNVTVVVLFIREKTAAMATAAIRDVD